MEQEEDKNYHKVFKAAEGPRDSSLTQDVMGSEGSESGRGGGAYRLVKSKSLNFFPIKASALSTCCWVPGSRTKYTDILHR